MSNTGKTVCVAMSGGVDSSTAALLLKEAGYNVFGVFMKLWDDEKKERGCCSLDDANDALRVCEKIGIPFYVLNLKEEFKREVIDYFVQEYKRGRTPNPCIYCNYKMKFDILFKKAKTFGADYIATGHYARIVKASDRYRLCKGVDEAKDQSYFLFSTPKEMLPHIIFPLGELKKGEVRAIAEKAGLVTSKKRESQEICFVKDDYREFLKMAGIKEKTGKIVDSKGKILGTHRGYFNFTIGQRSGLNIALGKPVYVKKIIPEENLIVVGEEKELYQTNFTISDCNFFEDWSAEERYFIKVRYRHKGEYGKIIKGDGNRIEAVFETPQRGITPGQAAVFYKDDFVVGGGWIE